MAGRFSKIIYERYGKKLDEVVNAYITSKFDISKIIDIKYNGLIKIYANDEIISFNAKYTFKDTAQKDLVGNLIKFKCYAHCECRITDDIVEFRIKDNVCDEPQLRTYNEGVVEYTDDLIPIDRKYPMYNDVSFIFKKYDFYKTSVEDCKVNVYKLAHLIGLKIHTNYVLKDINQSAMICYFDTELSLLNTKTNVIEKHIFKKGSIILNKNYANERGAKSVNFAIAHEIYHWLRHKYYIVLNHLTKDSMLYHTTFSRTQYFWKNEDERIEVQANKFAGTLLLQDRSIYNCFIASIYNNNYYFDIYNRENIVDGVLNEFSDLYQVSKKTLAIVLSSISKTEQQLPEFIKYKNDFKQQYDHYDIYEKEFIKLYLSDDKFYKLIKDRKLVYIKKRVVLNVDEAVKDGKITKFAKDNPDKYFITFTKTYSCIGERLSNALNSNSYKESIIFDKNKNAELITSILQEYETNEEAKKFEDESFDQQLYRYRTRLNIKQADLFDIGIATQSVSAYENGKEKPSLDNLIKIMIYYKLTPKEIKNLMKAGGYSFNNSDREKLLEYLVIYKRGASIDIINGCLKEHGCIEIQVRKD